MQTHEHVKSWLDQAGIAEAELARRCGYDKGNFHRMLRSGELGLDAALRLFDETGMQLGALAGLSEAEIATARKLRA